MRLSSGSQVSIAARFAWQVHMLNPKRYREDCIQSFGKVVPLPDSDAPSDDLGQVAPVNGRKATCTAESVERKPARTLTTNFTDFDLVGAIHRQLDFCRKILPLEKHVDRYLPLWMERYGMFLSLLKSDHKKADNERAVCVPTLNIDMIWHTHMLFPVQVRQLGICTCVSNVYRDVWFLRKKTRTRTKWQTKYT